MIRSDRNSFKKHSAYFEIDLKKSDTYDVVVDKVCSVFDLSSEYAALFTCRGNIICSTPITVSGKEYGWTLGAYLNKRHMSPDKIHLGIGLLSPDDPPINKRRKTEVISNYNISMNHKTILFR